MHLIEKRGKENITEETFKEKINNNKQVTTQNMLEDQGKKIKALLILVT